MPNHSYADLAAWLMAQQPRLGDTRLVVVDGPAGSGKTTFATRLSATVGGAPVVHMDDLFEGWSGLEGRLWERLHGGVLAPLADSRVGRYQRYDWDAEQFAEWHEVHPADVLIVEGVGAGHRGADAWASLRVWVEAPEAERLDRGVRRDGEALREKWVRWLRVEADHFQADHTRSRVDLIVDGSAGAEGGGDATPASGYLPRRRASASSRIAAPSASVRRSFT